MKGDTISNQDYLKPDLITGGAIAKILEDGIYGSAFGRFDYIYRSKCISKLVSSNPFVDNDIGIYPHVTEALAGRPG